MGDGVFKKRRTCDKPHYPFELPKGWCFCCINDIAESLLGKTLDKSKDKGVPKEYLCAINVQWGRFDFSILKSFLIGENEFQRYSVKQGDLMVCEGGDVGRCAIWEENEREMYYQNALHRIRCEYGISNYFLQYALWYYKLNGTIDYLCKGVTIKHFTQTTMSKLAIPLPPSNEQKRIVDEIQRLFSIIDKVEERKDKLQLTIRQTKSKILDLAIHGKLVPQDPSDEPATELLKRINPKAEITCDNPHYRSLPEGWAVCRLEDIVEIFDNLRKPINSNERNSRIANKHKDELYPYYGATGQVGLIDAYLIDGTYLLLGEDGAPFLDKSAVKAYPIEGRCWVNNHAHILRPLCDFDYLMFYLNQVDYKDYVNGSTRLKLTQSDMRSILVLLPPIAEQKHISAKVRALFDLLDSIVYHL